MRPSDLIAILDTELDSVLQQQHTPLMIWGAPGIGKSQLVMTVAEQRNLPVLDIRLSQMEPSDLRGIPICRDNLVEWAPPSTLPMEERHGPRGVLFLDEITSASPSISAAAYQLILDRRLGNYSVPPGWVIFSAGNREGDRGVTYTMPAPLANRFTHFDLEIHLDDWISWAFERGIDERIIGFLRFRPDLLFHFDASKNPIAFPTPRSWEFADRALKKFGQNTHLLLPSVQACVGQAAGLELCAFMHGMEKLPDLKGILAGQDVELPRELDLQYAVACALMGHVIRLRKDAQRDVAYGHVLNCAQNFVHKEVAVMLVADMYRVLGEDIFALPAFKPWADSIADVILA
ncbi:MAG: AAA family ATPase [Candidatus Oxydemutatoraceae bacterium WSBS_2016_MAG_OTU14]